MGFLCSGHVTEVSLERCLKDCRLDCSELREFIVCAAGYAYEFREDKSSESEPWVSFSSAAAGAAAAADTGWARATGVTSRPALLQRRRAPEERVKRAIRRKMTSGEEWEPLAGLISPSYRLDSYEKFTMGFRYRYHGLRDGSLYIPETEKRKCRVSFSSAAAGAAAAADTGWARATGVTSRPALLQRRRAPEERVKRAIRRKMTSGEEWEPLAGI
ncbi:hypothetical protein WN48_09742 [Eufriesea mexicana]|uniref:Uncharacterized protein n=1 Tax=Eufriesea mexicana TaxID=516756 RepID=A0A310SAB6_9HYME|nr:hypothetical protein WN48_09742 [Eufriesea mexicana]